MQVQKYRKNTAIFLIFLMLLTSPCAVWAEDAAENSPKKIITSITDSNGAPISSTFEITVAPGESDAVETVLWQLFRVYATVQGQETNLTLYPAWDYNALMTGLDTPGEYVHTVPVPADDYVFAEDVPQELTLVIHVQEAASKEPITPAVICSFDDFSHRYAIAIAAGTDWETFWQDQFDDSLWLQSWPCYTAEGADGEIFYADITWENPLPDTSQNGVFNVTGTASLPENTVLAEDVTLPTVTVPISVQTEPRLDCFCMDADVIYLPWVMGELKTEESLHYIASVNGGPWEDASEWMDTNGGSVCIWNMFLEENADYAVQAVWDTGETNIFTFTWTGAITDYGIMEGDRDGGDAEGVSPEEIIIQPKPDIEMPEESLTPEEPSVPENPITPEEPSTPEEPITPEGPSAPENLEAHQEMVTDTCSKLSGLRFLLMAQAGPVRFSKQGITVTLSEKAINDMHLSSDSWFSITIRKKSNGFTLNATLDNQPLIDLTGTLVQYPYTAASSDSQIFLLNEAGKVVAQGTQNASNTIVSFIIEKTGSYTITESALRSPEAEVPTAASTTAATTADIATTQNATKTPGIAEVHAATITDEVKGSEDRTDSIDKKIDVSPLSTMSYGILFCLLLTSVLFTWFFIRRIHR